MSAPIKSKHAESTIKTYEASFRLFDEWCRRYGMCPLPAEPNTVAKYIVFEAQRGIRPSTIDACLASIRHMHAAAGHELPTDNNLVCRVAYGIRKKYGVIPSQKAPITADRLTAILAAIPSDTLAGKRDRAMLVLGFAAALRRSELVALHVEDVVETPDVFQIIIRRSKTDQDGKGFAVDVPYGVKLRPYAVIREWLDASGITSGPLFRRINKAGRVSDDGLSGCTVADLVKRYATAAGFDPAEFSGHSLRAGFVTSAERVGATIREMQHVTRHKTADGVFCYVRDRDPNPDPFENHSGASFL